VRHPEALSVQAYFDGELDALATVEIERHIEQCPECLGQVQELEQTRAALRQLPSVPVPAGLRARVTRALDRESAAEGVPAPASIGVRMLRRAQPFWLGALSGGAATAAAALLAFVIWGAPLAHPLADDLVDAHLRSLMSTHLIDVVSTDRHTVKPWFAGRADVSPAVADFEAQGYKLLGGRVDYLYRQRAAVLVYQHDKHVINVFSWAAGREPVPHDVSRNGYHLACWRAADLGYCAVSDTGWDELLGLQRLMQSSRSGDAPE